MTIPFRLRPALLGAAALMLVLAAGASTAHANIVVHEIGAKQQQMASAEDFWTKERKQEAKPMPTPKLTPPKSAERTAGGAQAPLSLPRGPVSDGKPIYIEGQEPTIGPLARKKGHKGKKDKLPKHPKFKTGPVPPSLYGAAPIRNEGKLYMSFGQKFFTCSATVVASKTHTVIFTAGHCIFNKKLGFADRVAFFPASFGGQNQHGFWLGTRIITNGQWVKKKNEKFDYAAIKMAGPQGPIGSVVGESGLALNAGRRHRELALGYPNNLGGTQVMWACASRLIGDDPYDHGRGKKNIAIGCNMSHGCSGGGWQITRKGRYYVNSVSSYFYETKRFNNILFGPYLTKHARRVVSSAAR